MNLSFYSLPCAVKAILFDGTNHEEVVQIIKLNQGNARWLYLDKHNRPVEKDLITEQKGVWFRANGNGKEEWMITKDTYVIMDGDQGQMYPCDKEMFEQFHVDDPSKITNGQHTFHELYKELSKWNPTLEEILVTDKVSMEKLSQEVKAFIKIIAIIHTDSAHKSYYVVNGTVYVD